MKRIRYALRLLILFPTLALAQADSIHVEVAGEQYPGYGAIFGVRFPLPGTNIGPLLIVPVEGTGETAPPSEGCDPLVNISEVAGSIALVERGSCLFVEKVQNAVAAGAEAVVVYNFLCGPGDDTCEEPYVVMGGECEPAVCSIPAMFIPRGGGLSILEEIASGPTEATLIPVRVATPVALEETGSIEAFALRPVYPNPASGQITVTLDLPTAQTARVAVFDLLGREVAVLHDGPLAAGAHPLAFDAGALLAGVYVVRAVAGTDRITRKLVVAR